MKKCAVIINPTSGNGKGLEKIEEIKKTLNNYNYKYEIFITGYKGHAKEIVTNLKRFSLVISIGGDGTFNEVMQGNFLRKRKLLLAHIPFGTANDIGAMYGYTKDLITNLKLALDGVIKKIDICTINGIPFTYCAAFGKLTNVSYETPKDLKKRFGYLAYILKGLKEFNNKTKLYDIRYKVGDEIDIEKVSFILISNANRIAGINNFYENIYLDDNRFEVLLCNITNKKDIFKTVINLSKTDISKVPGFKFYKTNKLDLEFSNIISKAWSIDGEEFPDKVLEYKIRIVRNVKVLIPKKNVDKLFIGGKND